MASLLDGEASMTPSKIQACIWRGEETGDSFQCSQPEIHKEVCADDCRKCLLRHDPRKPLTAVTEKQSAMATISNGAVGIGKAILGIDRASEETIKERWDICQSCEFYKHWRCQACSCIVSMKIKIAGESCPKQKWGPKNGSVD